MDGMNGAGEDMHEQEHIMPDTSIQQDDAFIPRRTPFKYQVNNTTARRPFAATNAANAAIAANAANAANGGGMRRGPGLDGRVTKRREWEWA